MGDGRNPQSSIHDPQSTIPNPESRIPNRESRIPNPESRIAGMVRALPLRMAHKVEEFQVFRDAQRFCVAVSETLTGLGLRRDGNVYKQIEDANESILSNMSEGFAQESDDAFAKYLYYSKGSVEEVVTRLKRAAPRESVSDDAVARLEQMAELVCKQLGGLIKYLKRSGFKDRGRFRSEQNARRPSQSKESP